MMLRSELENELKRIIHGRGLYVTAEIPSDPECEFNSHAHIEAIALELTECPQYWDAVKHEASKWQ